MKQITRGMQNAAAAIQENFTELTENLTPEVVNLTLGGGNTGSARLYCIGKIVFIYFFDLCGKSSGGNDSTILTIPAAYRTPNSFEHLIGSTDRSALMSATIGFGADGTVKWRRNANYGSGYTFIVGYVLG